MSAFLRPVFQFLTYSHIWLALGAAAQTWWTCMYLGADLPRWRVVSAVFLGMFAAYSFLRRVRAQHEEVRTQSPLLQWHHTHQRELMISATVAAFGGSLLLAPGWSEVGLLIVMAVLPGLLYLVPCTYRGRVIGLRNVPGLKLPVILWCWLIATVALPVMLDDPDLFATRILAHGMVHGPLYVAIALLFDLRDQHIDPAGMRTVPQVIGISWTRALAVLLLLYAGAIVLLRGTLGYTAQVELEMPWPEVLASLGFLFGAMLAFFAWPKRGGRFFGLAVDGLLLLIPLLAWLGDLM